MEIENKAYAHFDKQTDKRKDNIIYLSEEHALEFLPKYFGNCSEYIKEVKPQDNDVVKIRFHDLVVRFAD